jgi:two-component system, chemotaxis family, chemotaxis protein CheY
MTHTVLLVEDEDDLREMMQEALEFNGFMVVAARDGEEALDALDKIEYPCVVLLDLVMPRMNGWEFFDKMRERPELARVPVVVHSSAPSRAPEGVTRVLQKPLQLDRLLSVVREYCTQ